MKAKKKNNVKKYSPRLALVLKDKFSAKILKLVKYGILKCFTLYISVFDPLTPIQVTNFLVHTYRRLLVLYSINLKRTESPV